MYLGVEGTMVSEVSHGVEEEVMDLGGRGGWGPTCIKECVEGEDGDFKGKDGYIRGRLAMTVLYKHKSWALNTRKEGNGRVGNEMLEENMRH